VLFWNLLDYTDPTPPPQMLNHGSFADYRQTPDSATLTQLSLHQFKIGAKIDHWIRKEAA